MRAGVRLARGGIAIARRIGIAHQHVDAPAVVGAHRMHIVHAHMRVKNPIAEGKAGFGVAIKQRIGKVEDGHGLLRVLCKKRD